MIRRAQSLLVGDVVDGLPIWPDSVGRSLIVGVGTPKLDGKITVDFLPFDGPLTGRTVSTLEVKAHGFVEASPPAALVDVLRVLAAVVDRLEVVDGGPTSPAEQEARALLWHARRTGVLP